MKTNPTYAQALIAEHDYTTELERVYGKRAVVARYNRNMSEATPELKRLAKIWHDLTEKLLKQV